MKGEDYSYDADIYSLGVSIGECASPKIVGSSTMNNNNNNNNMNNMNNNNNMNNMNNMNNNNMNNNNNNGGTNSSGKITNIWEVVNRSEQKASSVATIASSSSSSSSTTTTTTTNSSGGSGVSNKFSPELYKFVSAMSNHEPSKRPKAAELLKFEFITKYNNNNNNNMKPFLYSIAWLKDKAINEKKLQTDDDIHFATLGTDPLEVLKTAGFNL